MLKLRVKLEVYSIWGGEERFEGLTIRRFRKTRLLTLPWFLAYWICREPGAFGRLINRLVQRAVPSWKNLGETLVGLAFAIGFAHRLSQANDRPDLIHAAWATMPATGAQLIRELTGIPFSMGAHAYDVYQSGGDWLLSSKLQAANLVVTSSRATHDELLRRGARPERLSVVRWGLDPFPTMVEPRTPREPLRVLSVARLVEKKGFFEQLSIYTEVKKSGMPFEVRIVGDGPLRKPLRARCKDLGLSGEVAFLGSLSFTQVLAQFAWADVFVFTDKVAPDGDRDGLPNVILEAMATGTPVLSTNVSAVGEVVESTRNGILISLDNLQGWVDALLRLRDDDDYFRRLCRSARQTVESQYDERACAQQLLDNFDAVVAANAK